MPLFGRCTELCVRDALTYLDLGVRATAATVLTVALGAKLSSRTAFALFADSLRPVVGTPSGRASAAAAAALAMAEALVVVVLAALPGAHAGLVAAAVLLAAFSAVIALTMSTGRVATCRCFGASDEPLGVLHLIRNLGLAGFCLVPVMLDGGSAVDRVDVAAAVIATGVALGVRVTRAEDLAYAFAQRGRKASA
jgi:hypothetical protein